MFYPLGTVGEFEPFVNFSLNFFKKFGNVEKNAYTPHLKAGPSDLVNSDHFIKKFNAKNKFMLFFRFLKGYWV